MFCMTNIQENITTPARAGNTRSRYESRLLTKRQAAAYCGLSMSGYQAWVDEGLLGEALLERPRLGYGDGDDDQ